jgi:hypothetical protein
MKKAVFSIVLVVLSFVCIAQKAVHVSGEYRYVVPENVSMTEAKNTAIERARNEAMAKEFGTLVSQTNTTTNINVDGKSQTNFISVGGTESKGIWLADTKEPEVEVIFEDGTMVIIAKVAGRAREIKNAEAEMSVKLLCNGNESEHFKNNDKFSVKFKAATKGFVAIFLIDEMQETVYCLMPYDSKRGEARAVKGSTEYTFLSTKDIEYPFEEETILVTDKTLEMNTVTIVYSKNQFNIPLSEEGEYVPEIPAEKFSKWLRKNRINDETMQVIEKTVEIRKN